MIYTKILGTGSYVPSKVLTNDDLRRFVDTSDEWIQSRTGIKERRILKEEGQGTSFLAIKETNLKVYYYSVLPLFFVGDVVVDSLFVVRL